MKSRNKEEERKKKIITLLLFKYMIDYCSSHLIEFYDYMSLKNDEKLGISDADLIDEFKKLHESIKGDII